MRSTARLLLETLGERTLPSSTGTIPTEPLVPIIYQQLLHFNGLVHGDFSVQPLVTYTGTNYQITTDAGTTYQFSAISKLPHLGIFTVSGNITTLGNVMYGHATGQLTLTSVKGQITIDITGPLQKGGSHLPGHFTYQVISATGGYASLKDHGVINLYLATTHAQTTDLPQGHFWMMFS
jgi:hypothetical protein